MCLFCFVGQQERSEIKAFLRSDVLGVKIFPAGLMCALSRGFKLIADGLSAFFVRPERQNLFSSKNDILQECSKIRFIGYPVRHHQSINNFKTLLQKVLTKAAWNKSRPFQSDASNKQLSGDRRSRPSVWSNDSTSDAKTMNPKLRRE